MVLNVINQVAPRNVNSPIEFFMALYIVMVVLLLCLVGLDPKKGKVLMLIWLAVSWPKIRVSEMK